MRVEALRAIVARAPHCSIAQLARAAQMDRDHLSRMLDGQRPVHDRTLARMRFAVQRLRCGESEGRAETNALYRSLVVICAERMGRDPLQVQNTETRAKRVANKEWLANVHCHFVARYLLCQVFAVRQVDLARSLGVTRQAMQQGIAAVAEREETDSAFAAMLAALSDQLVGT